jgi:hypothetical protein
MPDGMLSQEKGTYLHGDARQSIPPVLQIIPPEFHLVSISYNCVTYSQKILVFVNIYKAIIYN